MPNTMKMCMDDLNSDLGTFLEIPVLKTLSSHCSLCRAYVRSLVRELTSHVPSGVVKNKMIGHLCERGSPLVKQSNLKREISYLILN